MIGYDFKGKKCNGCSQCIHADLDNMKCHPESDDCKSEYDLTEDDFRQRGNCDFFHRK